jgi:hypothetical protein
VKVLGNKMKKGFATVLVLIMSVALSMSVIAFWHTSSNVADIIIEKEKALQLSGYAECVIAYGIEVVSKHFDFFHNELEKQVLSFDMNDVIIQLGGTTELATLAIDRPKTITQKDQSIILNSTIEQGGYRCHIRCLVIKQKINDQCVIDGYTFVTSV